MTKKKDEALHCPMCDAVLPNCTDDRYYLTRSEAEVTGRRAFQSKVICQGCGAECARYSVHGKKKEE